MPIRIAVLSTYPPTNCGIAEFTKNMCMGIVSKDKEAIIEVFATDRIPHKGFPPSLSPRISVHQYSFSKRTEELTLARIATRINSGNFDVLLVQHELGLLHHYPNYEKFLNRIIKTIKTFVFIHTGNPYVSSQVRETIQRLAVSANYVVALGWKVKYFLEHAYGIPKSKVVYIPHGVQLAKIKGKVKKNMKRTTFLMAGLMREMKGIFDVLDAMHILKERRTLGNGFLHISGKDYTGGKLKEDFLRRARSLGLEKKVKWSYGFHPLKKLTKYHLQADVFLAPFKVEVPTSGTISFALGAGLATIATPFGLSGELLGLPIETPEYSAQSIKSDRAGGFVKYTKYGVVVPFNDTVSLANAMENLIKNRRKCRRMGILAKKRMKKITWKKVAGHMIDFIRTGKESNSLIKDAYKKHYLPSKGGWVGKKGTDLNNQPIGKISDGAYILYTDGYSVINGRIEKNKLVEVSVRVMTYKEGVRESVGKEVFMFASRKIHPKKGKKDRTVKLTKDIQIYSPYRKQKSIIKSNGRAVITTPNIIASVKVRKNGSINFKIMKVSRFSLSKGLIGFGILKKFSGFHQGEKRSPNEWMIKNWSSNVFKTNPEFEERGNMKGQFYGLPYTTRRNIKNSRLTFAQITHYPNIYKLFSPTKTGSKIREVLAKAWPDRRVHIEMSEVNTGRSLERDTLEKYVIKQLIREGISYTTKEKQEI